MILLEGDFSNDKGNTWSTEFVDGVFKVPRAIFSEILSRNEFLSLVSDILGALPGAEGEKYVDELEAVLDNRLPKSDLEDETWLSMPASEIDIVMLGDRRRRIDVCQKIPSTHMQCARRYAKAF